MVNFNIFCKERTQYCIGTISLMEDTFRKKWQLVVRRCKPVPYLMVIVISGSGSGAFMTPEFGNRIRWCESGSHFLFYADPDPYPILHMLENQNFKFTFYLFRVMDVIILMFGKFIEILWESWVEMDTYGSGSARMILIRPDRINIAASNATYHLQPTLPACCWRYSSCTCTSMLSLPSSTWYLPVSVSRLTSLSFTVSSSVLCVENPHGSGTVPVVFGPKVFHVF